jgi:hypothetical protein
MSHLALLVEIKLDKEGLLSTDMSFVGGCIREEEFFKGDSYYRAVRKLTGRTLYKKVNKNISDFKLDKKFIRLLKD